MDQGNDILPILLGKVRRVKKGLELQASPSPRTVRAWHVTHRQKQRARVATGYYDVIHTTPIV